MLWPLKYFDSSAGLYFWVNVLGVHGVNGYEERKVDAKSPPYKTDIVSKGRFE